MLRILVGLAKTDALLNITCARRMSAIPQYEGLKVEEKPSGVVSVELNRPESRNSFTLKQWKDISDVFNRLSDSSSCRAIVLHGSGKSFCAGIDLKSGITGIIEVINNEELDVARKARALRKMIQLCQDGFTAVEKCTKPVIAAVHGHCLGAGISLAGCCDVRYSTNDAIFSIKEADVGLAADVGILQRIQRLVGNDSWAREMAFTARNASGTEALKHGLVSRTFDTHRECLEAAFGLAGEIASKSPIAVQGTKLAMNYARNHGVDDSIEWILTWNQSQLQTEDIVKNAAAMMSKEKALFNDV